MTAGRLRYATTELYVVELARGWLVGREQTEWNRKFVYETRSVDE